MKRLSPHLLAMTFLLTGCASASVSLPEGAFIHPNNPALALIPVGKTDEGCVMYTKRALEEGVVTDAAIWVRDAEGRFVLDMKKCVPKED